MNIRLALCALLVAGAAHAQSSNTAEGENALRSDTSGDYNSAFGASALFSSNANYNSAFGAYTLYANTVGIMNVAVGYQALNFNQSGNENVAVGYNALDDNRAGNSNIGVGYEAGASSLTASNSIWIGNTGLFKDNKVIRIGTQGVQTFTQIAGIYDSKVTGGRAVVIDSKGHIGYASTKVVTSSLANSEETVSLRAEIAALRTELRALQAEVRAQAKEPR